MGLFPVAEGLSELAFALSAKPITYKRGGTVVADGVLAKYGRPTVKTEEVKQTNVQEMQLDFIVMTESLPVTPQIGDIITTEEGWTYQVSRPAKIPFSGMPANAPCWTWHTRQSHKQMRIHAKSVGGE